MADIMAQRRQPDNALPIHTCLFVVDLGEHLTHVLSGCRRIRNDVVDAAGQLHRSEGVFEPPVGRAWVHEVGHRQLVDVPEALQRRGVDHPPLVRVDADEVVHRVAELVPALGRRALEANVCTHVPNLTHAGVSTKGEEEDRSGGSGGRI